MSGHAPEPGRRTGGDRCIELRYATTAQFIEAVVPVLPLPPKIRAYLSADPRLQVREHTRGLAEAEVATPSNDVWRQLFDQLRQAGRPCPACPVIRVCEPQESALLRSRHHAFPRVVFQPELAGQEPADR